MDLLAHDLPKPEDGGTMLQAHKELALIASWARTFGFPGVYWRINWVLRVLIKSQRRKGL
jgi:hypothetical protein